MTVSARSPSRVKLFAVIAGAIVMVAAAFIFYANWLSNMQTSSRIYEQSPEFLIYAELENYNMTRGETITIPISMEVNQKGREVAAQVAVYGEQDIEDRVFVVTGDQTLPEGFTGTLDRSSIYLPSNTEDAITTETVQLTLTSDESLETGEYVFSPTVFSKDIVGSDIWVSSSFTVHVE